MKLWVVIRTFEGFEYERDVYCFSSEEKLNKWADENFIPQFNCDIIENEEENLNELLELVFGLGKKSENDLSVFDKMSIWNFCKLENGPDQRELFYCEDVELDQFSNEQRHCLVKI